MGALTGNGFFVHQAMVYLFNRFGGFTFGPVRKLCDAVGISQDEFLVEVMAKVRMDNKRGYVACTDCTKSVDQLVQSRPGRMLKCDDPNAAIRYLTMVDESSQIEMLERAWAGEFDKVAVLGSAGTIEFVNVDEATRADADAEVLAEKIRDLVWLLFHKDNANTRMRRSRKAGNRMLS